jgi:hypothetical protein
METRALLSSTTTDLSNLTRNIAGLIDKLRAYQKPVFFSWCCQHPDRAVATLSDDVQRKLSEIKLNLKSLAKSVGAIEHSQQALFEKIVAELDQQDLFASKALRLLTKIQGKLVALKMDALDWSYTIGPADDDSELTPLHLHELMHHH